MESWKLVYKLFVSLVESIVALTGTGILVFIFLKWIGLLHGLVGLGLTIVLIVSWIIGKEIIATKFDLHE